MENLSNNVVIIKKENNQEFLQFKRLLQYSDTIVHAYSVGISKNYRTFKADKTELSKDDYENNLENYKSLCQINGLDYKNLVKANQSHTDKIIRIDKIENENKTIDTKEEVDGLITDKKNIILATTNADCILFLFFDPIKKVIANIHSGWKGTLQEISVKTVNKMKEEYGCKPENIIVCILPSIRKCHFEVTDDVYNLFYKKFKKLGNLDDFILKNDNKYFIDTVLINKIILKKAGILDVNIEDCGICSVCNKGKIHSFRAEGPKYGLATALISIK